MQPDNSHAIVVQNWGTWHAPYLRGLSSRKSIISASILAWVYLWMRERVAERIAGKSLPPGYGLGWGIREMVNSHLELSVPKQQTVSYLNNCLSAVGNFAPISLSIRFQYPDSLPPPRSVFYDVRSDWAWWRAGYLRRSGEVLPSLLFCWCCWRIIDPVILYLRLLDGLSTRP